MYDRANTYIDVAAETATMLVEEMTAANRRALGYVSSLAEIVKGAQPAAAEGSAPTVAQRIEAVLSLNAKELETSLRTSADMFEKFLAQTKKLQQVGS